MSRTPSQKKELPPVGVPMVGGVDPPEPLLESDPTIGYKLNHFMLRIRDPEATLNFYVKLMGMRVIWTLNTGPFTGYYMGYPESTEHRMDPLKYAKHVSPHATLTSTTGLLELCHFHGAENLGEDYITPGYRGPHIGFNHLGFTVPDVRATVERLRNAGVKIVKDLGVETTDELPMSRWEVEEKKIAVGEITPGFLKLQRQFAFVEDPNGYLVEIVPQTLVL